MPTKLANQRVSGKVSSMTATKRVIGNARKAPGPPRSQAQNTNDRNTIVGDHERRRRGNPAPSQPGVDRAEQERKDHGEEDGIEDRRGQAHPDEHDHRHGKDTQHPHE